MSWSKFAAPNSSPVGSASCATLRPGPDHRPHPAHGGRQSGGREGVSELRINYGPGYRVYLVRRGETVIILLCGGDKSTQQQDIRTALMLAKEV